MQKEIELVCQPDYILNLDHIESLILTQEKLKKSDLTSFKIRKRSIDARSKNPVYRLKVILYIKESPSPNFFSINYPKMKATIYLTYKPVNNDITKLLRDAQKLTFEHVVNI